MKSKIPEIDLPKYKDDILEQLRYHDGCPAIIRLIRNLTDALEQHLSRAADEIEELRAKNKALRKETNN